MKLALFGATGGTGRCLIEQALQQEHEVTAFVRNPSALNIRHPKLALVQGDIVDLEKVQAAVAEKDAVLCALGTSNEPHTTVLSRNEQHS